MKMTLLQTGYCVQDNEALECRDGGGRGQAGAAGPLCARHRETAELFPASVARFSLSSQQSLLAPVPL